MKNIFTCSLFLIMGLSSSMQAFAQGGECPVVDYIVIVDNTASMQAHESVFREILSLVSEVNNSTAYGGQAGMICVGHFSLGDTLALLTGGFVSSLDPESIELSYGYQTTCFGNAILGAESLIVQRRARYPYRKIGVILVSDYEQACSFSTLDNLPTLEYGSGPDFFLGWCIYDLNAPGSQKDEFIATRFNPLDWQLVIKSQDLEGAEGGTFEYFLRSMRSCQ